jgi:hypothetical protein
MAGKYFNNPGVDDYFNNLATRLHYHAKAVLFILGF